MSENASIDNKAGQKSKDEQNNEEKVRGYVPRECDFKCYKCPYQGVCVIPRRLVEARRRYVIGIENKKPLNRRYGMNNFNSIFSLYDRLFRPIFKIFSRLNKNFSRYRRKSKYD